MYKIAFGKISALFNAISSVEKLYVPTDKDDIALFKQNIPIRRQYFFLKIIRFAPKVLGIHSLRHEH